MANKPNNYPEWAINLVEQTIEKDGLPVVAENKTEPSLEWKTNGILNKVNLPYNYLNYQFDLLDSWTKHLDERYSIGDVHITASTESVLEISDRLGGTWVFRGTESLASNTYNVFEKTA